MRFGHFPMYCINEYFMDESNGAVSLIDLEGSCQVQV